MASNLHNLLSVLLLLSTILNSPATTTAQECPYPCYPPPTGPGNNPPAATTPPAPPTSTTPPSGSLSPPFSISPPAGYFPLAPPPPYSFGVAPPPPDPIVPWFPYYYRKPLHDDQSSSPAHKGSRNNIIFSMFIVSFSYFFH